MVHFDFIVDDADAENIMSALRDQLNKCNDEIMQCMVDLPEHKLAANIQALQKQKDYWQKLILKVKTKKVDV